MGGGRTLGRGVQAMGMVRRAALPLAAALSVGAAGCGALEVPDLGHGLVQGKLTGARTVPVDCFQADLSLPCTPTAYVYPLGHPELRTAVAADGSYALTVPAGSGALVLFDGAQRSEIVPVDVRGADLTTVPERFGDAAAVDDTLRMPRSSLVVASVQVACGATVKDPQFTLRETDHVDVGSTAAFALLWPVPQGSFDLAAVMPGFRPGVRSIVVGAGTTLAPEVALDVDDGEREPGCASTSCPVQLPRCNPTDGFCYQCLSDDDCTAPGSTCDLPTHSCVATPGGGTFQACATCSGDSDCGVYAGSGTATNPSLAAVCRSVTTQSGATFHYCTVSGCAAGTDCPSGFSCGTDGFCKPPEGCYAWAATFGASCTEGEGCREHLAGGRCVGGSEASAGTCTAPCGTDADCPAALGYAQCAAGLCAAP